MKRFFRVAACALAGWLGAVAALGEDASVWQPGGMIRLMDLASDTAWTARLDGGAPRPIKVPAGGWNSDLQSPRIQVLKDVKDHVIYERKIVMPPEAAGRVARLLFGGVNYGAEVSLDGRVAGVHHGPMTPFSIDLTALAQPGREQVLSVKAYHRRHYLTNGSGSDVPVGWDYPEGADAATRAEAKAWSPDWHGQSKNAYGIARSIQLAILPEIYVSEFFIRPSVPRRQLSCDAVVHNFGTRDRHVRLRSELSSWNRRSWNYPAIPDAEFTVPAGGDARVVLGPVDWTPGPESYWQPNIPFREDYQAQLHYWRAVLLEEGTALQTNETRFGFVEHAEGPYYYTVNGARVFGISDGTPESSMSFFDSYAASPAFASREGCLETWRRYQRIGLNFNRLHCSMPTQLMMDAADEAGFMLIPEAAIWNNGSCRYHPDNTAEAIREMVRHSRNHPSVARYSLANEIFLSAMDSNTPWRGLVDAAAGADPSRPCIIEGGMYLRGTNQLRGWTNGSARITEHYTRIERPLPFPGSLRSMGEDCWSKEGIAQFPLHVARARMADLAYLGVWTWNNYWPNFLDGMDAATWADQRDCCPNRVPGVNGWGSPIIQYVQRGLAPCLVVDRDIFRLNQNPAYKAGEGAIQWPYAFPEYAAGQPVTNTLVVFNGELSGSRMELRWNARWDKPDGEPLFAPQTISLFIEPGFHTNVPISFSAPAIDGPRRKVFLALESIKDGRTVNREDRYALLLTRDKPAKSAASLASVEPDAHGNWPAVCGTEGWIIPGVATNLPAYARVAWAPTLLTNWAPEAAQARMLYAPAPPFDKTTAFATANPVKFSVDAKAPCRLALYMVDGAWPKRRQHARQTITLSDPSGRKLAQTTISEYILGQYVLWNVQGPVNVEIASSLGENATLSGIFFDPP